MSDTHALRVPRIPAGWLLLATSALVAAAVWAEAHNQGKNNLDTLPLGWLFVEVAVPPLSVACLTALCRRPGRSPWRILLATLLTAPQCIVWFFAVGGVLYYLGLIR